jgi:hypothetical protein
MLLREIMALYWLSIVGITQDTHTVAQRFQLFKRVVHNDQYSAFESLCQMSVFVLSNSMICCLLPVALGGFD